MLAGALAAAAAATGGCGGQDEVVRYCNYGAVSEAQRQGCIDHVTSDDIDQLDTNAARYARGMIDDCRADAGPFCGQ